MHSGRERAVDIAQVEWFACGGMKLDHEAGMRKLADRARARVRDAGHGAQRRQKSYRGSPKPQNSTRFPSGSLK